MFHSTLTVLKICTITVLLQVVGARQSRIRENHCHVLTHLYQGTHSSVRFRESSMTGGPFLGRIEVANTFREKAIEAVTIKRGLPELLTTVTVDLIPVAVDQFTHRQKAVQGAKPTINYQDILNAASVELILATIDKTTRLSDKLSSHTTMTLKATTESHSGK